MGGQLKGRFWLIAFSLVVLFGALSLLTPPAKPDHPGGPLLAGAKIDPETLAVFQRSCQDCHSENTTYPWYSYVAPVSWLIESDVSRGRRHLNLSQWSDYPLQKRERSLSEIANQVKDRDMPVFQYLLIHRNAKLSDADVNRIFQWTQTERARLISENAGSNH
jgi:mono/diheme cytochrome c family protein